MTNTLTITEHAKITISEKRDIGKKLISERDAKLLLDIKHETREGKEIKVFSYGGNFIKANSIVGSISIKSGLIIEILPKFAKKDLEEESIKKHRKILLNMIRVSKEKKFISSTTQSSKVSVGEMPLIRYMIELFSESLLIALRNSTFSNYTRTIKNSSFIKGNILVSKTIQNNLIDKSKVYVSYNKHSMNNLLMQVFKTLSKILLNDTNLSYRAKQNLYEVYLLLDTVEIIKIKQQDFSKITFNRLNNKFEDLFKQAEFIYNQYMPFTSNINSTPFWAILFNMDYLFEKFCAYLFRRSNIEIEEQVKTDCFTDGKKTVRMKPDFLLFENNNIISVVDAKWKLVDNKGSLYGLSSDDFWQLFSYMNLTNSEDELNGYFIVPKYGNSFEDEITFEPINTMKKNGKSIIIFSIDFSLDFEELIEKYRFKIIDNKLKLQQKTIEERINQQKEKFNFEEFINELKMLNDNKNKNLLKHILDKHTKFHPKCKNSFFLAKKQKVDKKTFIEFMKQNILISGLNLDELDLQIIPDNILYLKNLQYLDLSSNNISTLPLNLFKLKKLKRLNLSKNKLKNIKKNILNLKKLEKLIIDKIIVFNNIYFFEELVKKNIKILDENGNNLSEYIHYLQMNKEEKITFVNNSDFNSISLEIIEMIMNEEDIDILEDFTYNKTLPLEFAFATYNNNFERNKDKLFRLKENLSQRKNKILNWILDWDIDAQKRYIHNNFNKIDKEILLAYEMSRLSIFKEIKEEISIYKSQKIKKQYKSQNINI